MVENINFTYSFTIYDRELCMADFVILGIDGIANNTMKKNFSKF